uniref:Uncharacterized protein n=1 Tax=uncultured marine virus TaxID=186617 RepID=A0A0F7L0F5_9VIRU|nr:hypothetical protein [uncultured marine virus]
MYQNSRVLNAVTNSFCLGNKESLVKKAFYCDLAAMLVIDLLLVCPAKTIFHVHVPTGITKGLAIKICTPIFNPPRLA